MKPKYLFLFPLLAHAAIVSASPSDVYVTVREAKLRSKQDFFSPTTADVRYGDKLSVLGESGAWYSVKTGGGKQGYIHQSAITERKVVLSSSAKFTPTQASDNDVVLAGKGFNADVERRFAAQHTSANFSEVNAMERVKVSPAELTTFVEQGKLGKKEG